MMARAVCVLIVLAGLAVPGCGRQSPEHPNIVFILVDDQRADAMSCAGHPWIRTPEIDRLADEGVRFTSAFVATSLCSPSRASFLSGLYPHRHGVIANEDRDLPSDVPQLGTLLQAAGYETAYIGKWHMARWSTPRPGFDRWVSFNGQGHYERNTFNVDGEWVLEQGYVTDVLTRYAIDFLDRDRDRPFLLVLAHKAVHAPFVPAPRHAALYEDAPIATPESTPEALAAQPDWGGREPERDSVAFQREYARTLAAVDESTGAILDRLRASGLLDDTVVVYASDNGFLAGEHGGLWDKRAAYDPSIRVPLLIRYPARVPQGATNDALALNIDLLPTLLELAGVPVPPEVQGESLLPVLDGAPGREAFLYEYFAEQGEVPTTLAVRSHRWKYVTYPDQPELGAELYDLRADPGELANLAGESGFATVTDSLRAELDSLRAVTGYPAR